MTNGCEWKSDKTQTIIQCPPKVLEQNKIFSHNFKQEPKGSKALPCVQSPKSFRFLKTFLSKSRREGHFCLGFHYLKILYIGSGKIILGRTEKTWGGAILGPGVIIFRNLKEDHPRNIPVKFGCNWPGNLWELQILIPCLCLLITSSV